MSLEQHEPPFRYDLLVAHVVIVVALKIKQKKKRNCVSVVKWRSSAPKLQRTRHHIQEVHDALGPVFFRRAYRMSLHCFKTLVAKIEPYMVERKPYRAVINGYITNEVRVATAIRYFAGASPYADLCTTFGIAYSEVFHSIWSVVDAVIANPAMAIVFPEDHEQQQQLAREFKKKSRAQFDCCVGAIDGILIWTRRPSQRSCSLAACDAAKFMCGRKKKFGLNCQAVCDANGRYLAVGLRFPGSTADCLAFEGMSLHGRLQDGLLKPGLCLFGDNAYVNSPFMSTPYQGGNLSVEKDSYNYYHSQLRITIECAFGRLTQRWGILRTAFSHTLSIKKIIHVTLAIFRLENFLLDQKEQSDIPPMTACDVRATEMRGSVPLDDTADGQAIPSGLIGGGHHFDGVTRADRRRLQRLAARGTPCTSLPRERLLGMIVDSHLRRPPVTGRVS